LDPLPEDTHAPDSPTLSLIAALRQQISLLTDQSTDLNTKLITQLERASDLEDNLEGRRQQEQEKDVLIKKLEAEKAQWEENMNTGLLVERGSVREEMQRLVEGLVEEERRRGSAEAGRQQVEQEIDDLSVTLFEQVRSRILALSKDQSLI
jgi:chromosome segregation ATPase